MVCFLLTELDAVVAQKDERLTFEKVAWNVQQVALKRWQHVRFLERESLRVETREVLRSAYTTGIFCLNDQRDASLEGWLKRYVRGLTALQDRNSLLERVLTHAPFLNCSLHQGLPFS